MGFLIYRDHGSSISSFFQAQTIYRDPISHIYHFIKYLNINLSLPNFKKRTKAKSGKAEKTKNGKPKIEKTKSQNERI
jgi:ligand-binding sensor protein